MPIGVVTAIIAAGGGMDTGTAAGGGD